MATRKLPEAVPVDELIVHTPRVAALLLREHVLSVDENPEPEITTVIPIAPEGGVKVTVGPMTVKMAATVLGPTRLVPVPVTVTVYGPGVFVPTTKDPTKV